MMHTITVLTAAVALTTYIGTDARAQLAGDALEATATALDVYEATKTQCYYAPVVRPALDQLADNFAQAEPYRWKRAVRGSANSAPTVQNFAKILGGGSTTNLGGDGAPPRPVAPANPNVDCVSTGLMIGMALPYAAMMSQDPKAVFEDGNRLIKAEGRLRAQGE